MKNISRYFPILDWGKSYDRMAFSGDLLAAMIVTIMLIPQSLAYAMLAGLPPVVGLYASILPLIAYAIFGTSRALAVGPVAVVSLLTAAAVSKIAAPGSPEYLAAAILLAFLSGVFLLILGLARIGFLANFLSHPVISGFITASGIIIAVSQLKYILGIKATGENLPALVRSIAENLKDTNLITLAIGVSATAFLFWARKNLKGALEGLGIKSSIAAILARTGPVAVIATTMLAAYGFSLKDHGVKLVGAVPQSLPTLTMPEFSIDKITVLLGSAALLSIIGFVESISVAQTLAAKKRQRIDPDQELIALGASNLASAFSGGYPVTGGFARSIVNYDAGAQTPAAGAYTAIGLAVASLTLTPLLAYLPQAILAATIIVAVLSLVDFSILWRAWAYSKADFFAVTATILATLLLGVETGISIGVLSSIIIHLYKSSRPHMAIVGQIPGTEHYRNVDRHQVITTPHILSLRVDESLYFANARFLEDRIYALVTDNKEIRDVVLMCPAVNEIDISALESLEAINERLAASNVRFHLSEVKGPVMDALNKVHFTEHLSGKIFLSQHQAITELSGTATATLPNAA
jgi:SulP family sulfate permease